MSDSELRLPEPDDLHDPHAAEVQAVLAASYAAHPAHPPAHVERVTRAVLAAAMHAPAPSSHGLRPRWWWGAAAAAVLMIAVMRPWRPDVAQRGADSAVAGPSGDRPTRLSEPSGRTSEEAGGTVRFEFTLPSSARAVALVGDFNGWDTDATPMSRQGEGRTWAARIPLAPGRHEYAFVVDGQRWVIDPLAPQVPDAGFGPTNTVVIDGAVGQ
jgi:hypothetical protein